jgi:hypothetical protein
LFYVMLPTTVYNNSAFVLNGLGWKSQRARAGWQSRPRLS